MIDNEPFLIQHVEGFLQVATKRIKQDIAKAVRSGAIDVDKYETRSTHDILPKAVLVAVLEVAAKRYKVSEDISPDFNKMVEDLKNQL